MSRFRLNLHIGYLPIRKTHLLAALAAFCFVVPIVVGDPLEDPSHLGPLIVGDLPDGLEHANHGAFVGSTVEAVTANNVRQPDALQGGGFDLPTGGLPSPLFGAQPFTQQMLRFEEFGCDTLAPATAPCIPLPIAADAQSWTGINWISSWPNHSIRSPPACATIPSRTHGKLILRPF